MEDSKMRARVLASKNHNVMKCKMRAKLNEMQDNKYEELQALLIKLYKLF